MIKKILLLSFFIFHSLFAPPQQQAFIPADNLDFIKQISNFWGGGVNNQNADDFLKFVDKHGDKLQKMAKVVGDVGSDLLNNAQEYFESEISKLEKQITAIEKQINLYEEEMQNKYSKHSPEYWEKEILRLKNKKDKIEEKIEHKTKLSDQTVQDLRDLTFGTAKQALHGWVNEKLQEERLKEDRKNEVRKWATSVKIALTTITAPETLIRIVGAGLSATAGFYGLKIGFNYLDSIIGKPELIRESTRHDWKHNLKSFWTETILHRKPPTAKLNEVIMSPKITQRLNFLADDTKSTKENGLPYSQVLLYGPPGTGKTMFAKKLALYSGMDYAYMTGADFEQFTNGQDIIQLHKIFDWAQKSKKGLLLFIDEAEKFLGKKREKNLLSAFLSRTGTTSDKFMLVFTTNRKQNIDDAILDRIDEKIHFLLPGLQERIKIFNLYFDKLIRNDERMIKRGENKIKMKINIEQDIDNNFIENVAQKINGFSGRRIEKLVIKLQKCAYNQDNGNLTKEIMNQIVDEKIKEYKGDCLALTD